MIVMEVKTYLVEGMFCKNCKIHVENGIKNIPGIEDVIVDISNGQVRVSGRRILDEEVKAAVEQSGYIFGGEIAGFRGEINGGTPNSEIWIS
jgi:copper chaperone CopZ